MARKFISKNPFSQEVYQRFESATASSLHRLLQSSHSAFTSYKSSSFADRASKMRALGESLRINKESLGLLMSQEMGKPLTQSMLEVGKSAEACDYYATNAESLLAPHSYSVSGVECYVQYEPLGTVFSIMPFNFPVWMPLKCSIPLMMAGNSYVFKPPENTPRTALRLEELAQEAGLPLRTAFVDIDQVEDVIQHPAVKGVTVTGSITAGRAIASIAGKHLKKIVLELGGSDPFILLKDCDVAPTANLLVSARLMGCGQVCISPKRVFVPEEMHDSLVEIVVNRVNSIEITDPTTTDCVLGPMAREDLTQLAKKQVDESVAMGAKLVTGGQLEGPCLFKPAVLTQVTDKMPVFKTETFAPVFSFIQYKNEQEAFDMANQEEFGLGATIVTRNIERAKRELVGKLDAGMVFVNDFVKSFVNVPFGGIKSSGFGRELGDLGIKEFTNAKAVVIKDSV